LREIALCQVAETGSGSGKAAGVFEWIAPRMSEANPT